AEEERVEERDRTRAHGEDVAHDPAHPGGRALERLDRARMVMALDLEDAGEAAAEIDRAGVLAGTDDDLGSVGRKASQEEPGVLVRAVLAPERPEHAQLEVRELAPDAA